jgi:hypothetical protein
LNDFKERLKLLAEFRNSAIHLGEVVEAERKEIFHEFLASTSLLIDEMAFPRTEFFGDFEQLVSKHLDKSLTDAGLVAAEKIARAKSEYGDKYGSLDPLHSEQIIDLIERSYDLREL